jgi:hypothetical protein
MKDGEFVEVKYVGIMIRSENWIKFSIWLEDFGFAGWVLSNSY